MDTEEGRNKATEKDNLKEELSSQHCRDTAIFC